jgi:hypothetical protein
MIDLREATQLEDPGFFQNIRSKVKDWITTKHWGLIGWGWVLVGGIPFLLCLCTCSSCYSTLRQRRRAKAVQEAHVAKQADKNQRARGVQVHRHREAGSWPASISTGEQGRPQNTAGPRPYLQGGLEPEPAEPEPYLPFKPASLGSRGSQHTGHSSHSGTAASSLGRTPPSVFSTAIQENRRDLNGDNELQVHPSQPNQHDQGSNPGMQLQRTGHGRHPAHTYVSHGSGIQQGLSMPQRQRRPLRQPQQAPKNGEESERAYEEAYDEINMFRELNPPKGGTKAVTRW